jgi:hypothetical protein
LVKGRREKGKTAPRAVEAIDIGFATYLNTSEYKIFIPSTGQVLTSNQLVFDESFSPYRKEKLVRKLSLMKGMMELISCLKLLRLLIG